MANEKINGEVPRYKLTQPAYIDDIYYDPESRDPRFQEVNYLGIPGYHMEPVNAAARTMKEKHPSTHTDPILAMTDMTASAGQTQMSDMLAKALAQALSQGVKA